MNDLAQIANRLATNIATTSGENTGETKITLDGFYYDKYGEYNLNYHVNDSVCTLCLAEIPITPAGIFLSCREPHRRAIIELDRVVKTHYAMEALLKEIQPNQPDEIAAKITEILNVKGREK